MKKIILLLIVGFTTLMGIEFTMTESGLYPNVETQPTPSTPVTNGWVGKPLPTKAFNVLDYGLKGDGVTDDSAALKNLAKNTSVTNWYFPAGKTFRLRDIDVQNHVTAIWGGGTIVAINKSTDTSSTQAVAFWVRGGNGIIDGLTFNPDTSRSFTGGLYSAYVSFPVESKTDGYEIRNCTFNGKGRLSDLLAVKASVAGGGHHYNMKIYNNLFNEAGHFAAEIGNLTKGTDQNVELTLLTNLEIFNNKIQGYSGWYGGLSIIQLGKNDNAKIYNNLIQNVDWGIELSGAGIDIYNNNIINVKKRPITVAGPGYSQYTTGTLPLGVSYIHHNHITTDNTDSTYQELYFYNGSVDKVYENFIGCRVKVYYDPYAYDPNSGPTNPSEGPDVYNNTIAFSGNVDSTWIILLNQVLSGSWYDNDIYGGSGSQRGVLAENGTTGVQLVNNNLYLNKGVSCYTNITQTSGTCNLNYTGGIPTTRSGAGLSDPNNIGVQ